MIKLYLTLKHFYEDKKLLNYFVSCFMTYISILQDKSKFLVLHIRTAYLAPRVNQIVIFFLIGIQSLQG